MTDNNYKVFLSYSWDDNNHENWVINLANKLREDGVNATIDKFDIYTKTIDMNTYMIKQVEENDYVIVVLTEGYAEKATSMEGGVGLETMLINNYLLKNNEKIIFVSRSKDREKSTPAQMKQFYSIDFSNNTKFDENFKELLHRIYKVPMYKMASIGKKPELVSEEVGYNGKVADKELKIVDSEDEERILWLLPRGYLTFDSITFAEYDSWAVRAHHYNYDGEWIHSTHYHDSYSREWDANINIQYMKLQIPKADRLYADSALTFLKNIRDINKKIDIEDKVSNLGMENVVSYYDPGTPIFLPEVPKEYEELYENGEIRDLLFELSDLSRLEYGLKPLDLSAQDVHYMARSIRIRVFTNLLKLLGENHPSLRFINEIIDKYEESASPKELGAWAKELNNAIVEIID